jgi:hypothetical protein
MQPYNVKYFMWYLQTIEFIYILFLNENLTT